MSIVFVDLDDVLADFCGAAAALHGRELETPPVSHWGLEDQWGMSRQDFWEPVLNFQPSEHRFWLDIKPKESGMQLVQWLKDYGQDWYVLTNPGPGSAALQAKVDWCRLHFGDPKFDRCIPTKHKQLLAAPGRWLIDDREETCQKFVEHGGNAIVWPHRSNSCWRGEPRAFEIVTSHLLKALV